MIQRYLSTGSFQFLGNKSSDFSDETDYSKLGTLKSDVSEIEKRLILKALEENRWHKGKVASLLGIDPKTLYRKMKRYGILS